MKKIIIITLIAFALIGCSNDDAPTQTSCNCVKLIQSRVTTVTITSTGQTSTTTPWQSAGAGQVPSDIKDCSQNGKVVLSNSQSNQNKIIEIRHILSCK